MITLLGKVVSVILIAKKAKKIFKKREVEPQVEPTIVVYRATKYEKPKSTTIIKYKNYRGRSHSI